MNIKAITNVIITTILLSITINSPLSAQERTNYHIPGYGLFSFQPPPNWIISATFNRYTGKVDFEIKPSRLTANNDFAITISPELIQSNRASVKLISQTKWHHNKNMAAPIDRVIFAGEMSLQRAKEKQLHLKKFAKQKGQYFLLTHNRPTSESYRHFGYGVLVKPKSIGDIHLVFSYESNSLSNTELNQLLQLMKTLEINIDYKS